jgi:hypothetical protein
LWHDDFLEKVTLTDRDRTGYQFTLQDDYSRGYSSTPSIVCRSHLRKPV